MNFKKEKIKGFCFKCNKIVPAEIILINGYVHIRTICKKHGSTLDRHVWDDPELYHFFMDLKGSKGDPARSIIRLTNQCNLKCSVCYAYGGPERRFRFNRKLFYKLKKQDSIYLSGGEPTLREDLFEIIKSLKKHHRVSIFTNGFKLLDKNYLRSLKLTGLDMIFLQFDSLHDEDYKEMRNKVMVKEKRKILTSIIKEGLPVYLVSTMVKNKSLNGLKDLFKYSLEKEGIIGIGLNALARVGRFKEEYFVPTSEIVNEVCLALSVSKKDFMQTTELLMNLDHFLSRFTKKRYISRCALTILFLSKKDTIIPITKIFDIERINKYLKRLILKNKMVDFFRFGIFILTKQFFFNLIFNSNFRLLAWRFFKKLKSRKKHNFFINPFFIVSVFIWPSRTNFDLRLLKTCNWVTFLSEKDPLTPACFFRLKNKEKVEKEIS